MTRVLVLDDSTTVRMDLTDSLEEAGFAVVGAASIAEARATFAAGKIDLAILDVVLPDGSGTDLLAWLRTQDQWVNLPVLMLSTEAEVKDRVKGLRIGASDYIGKPYDANSVIARVEQLTKSAAHITQRNRILVVDDSPTVREHMVKSLHDAGYATISASDGVEGLQMAARERPNAIIVDGVMPNMDGATLIRRIRLDPALRATPCLMLTGSRETSDEVEALEAGADAFATKDADVQVVLARLSAMLRSTDDPTAGLESLHAPKRVLLVDNDRELSGGVASILHDNGYDVAQTSASNDAIELVSVQRIDCILLDWHVSGAADVCAQIKSAPTVRDTPVLAITDSADRTVTMAALAAGADDVVDRSAGLELLAARVRAQIRRRKVEDERRKARENVVRGELMDQLEQANARLTATNEELEAFSYSVSHDLRAPLRAIGSFTSAVLEDAGPVLDENSKEYLQRVVRAATSMGEMIEALLELSRVSRAAIVRESVDLTSATIGLLDELAQRDPHRVVTTTIQPGMKAQADRRLVRVVLDNLLGNAWKFTSQKPNAEITVGMETHEGLNTVFVRDNGAGFDAAQATNLFRPFKRLHTEKQFAGTGIGLATTRRIVERHGGKLWATSQPGEGATFYVTFTGA
ncbi:MAG TPA: response regulator [Kofleriaceae bacterium]|jgi:DNA-binding response OmpR family regulator